MKKNHELQGRIILYQEERIRMVDDRGASFLFDLAQDVPVSSEDLSHWIEERARIIVSYSGEPETENGVVHSIRKAA